MPAKYQAVEQAIPKAVSVGAEGTMVATLQDPATGIGRVANTAAPQNHAAATLGGTERLHHCVDEPELNFLAARPEKGP